MAIISEGSPPGGAKVRVDPIEAQSHFHRTESRIAVAGHPIHAMLVTFPIALTMCTLGADGFYWWTGDAFWARAALWASLSLIHI